MGVLVFSWSLFSSSRNWVLRKQLVLLIETEAKNYLNCLSFLVYPFWRVYHCSTLVMWVTPPCFHDGKSQKTDSIFPAARLFSASLVCNLCCVYWCTGPSAGLVVPPSWGGEALIPRSLFSCASVASRTSITLVPLLPHSSPFPALTEMAVQRTVSPSLRPQCAGSWFISCELSFSSFYFQV